MCPMGSDRNWIYQNYREKKRKCEFWGNVTHIEDYLTFFPLFLFLFKISPGKIVRIWCGKGESRGCYPGKVREGQEKEKTPGSRKKKWGVLKLAIKYIFHQGSPEDFSSWPQLVKLNQEIFGPESRLQKAGEMDNLFIQAALDGERIIGYKIGYPYDSVTFYSWMGGVDPDYRGQGIARELMRQQHQWCAHQGYLEVQTKTQNRWREMLMLNISSGFDIIGCQIDRRGELKIILSKNLTDNLIKDGGDN